MQTVDASQAVTSSNPNGLNGHLRVRVDAEMLKEFPGWRVQCDFEEEHSVMREDFRHTSCFVAVRERVFSMDCPPLRLTASNDDEGVETHEMDVKAVIYAQEAVVLSKMPASGLQIWVEYFPNGKIMNP